MRLKKMSNSHSGKIIKKIKEIRAELEGECTIYKLLAVAICRILAREFH